MKRGNQKRKGSEFEREVAKILSSWWDKELYKKSQLVFWRTHASGGAKHISKQQSGDITYIHESGKPLIDLFVIECKRTKRYNLFGLVAGDKSLPIYKWLNKLKKEAQSNNKYGFLIFKMDRYPIMCAIETCISKKLCHHSDLCKYKVLRLYKPYPFDVYNFNDFLTTVKKETIIKIRDFLFADIQIEDEIEYNRRLVG